MKRELTKEEQQKLQIILKDPVLWAKGFLRTQDPKTKKLGPWIARDYQTKVLRDPSLRKVLRMGRRLGKCLPGWVEVLNGKTGQRQTVEELYKQKSADVVSLNLDYQLTTKEGCRVVRNGPKPVYRVLLSNDYWIDATANHPLLTPVGWKRIDQLSAGEVVGMPYKLNVFGNGKLPDSLVKIIAFMTWSRYDPFNGRYVFMPRQRHAFLQECLKEYHHTLVRGGTSPRSSTFYVKPTDEATDAEKAVIEGVMHDPAIYEQSFLRRIPGIVFTLNKRLVTLFMSTLLSLMLNMEKPRKEWYPYRCSVYAGSEFFIRDLRHLLLRFGIMTSVPQAPSGRYPGYSFRIEQIENVKGIVFTIGLIQDLLKKQVGDLEAIKLTLRGCRSGEKYMPKILNEEIKEAVHERGMALKDLRAVITAVTGMPNQINLNSRLSVKNFKIVTSYLELNDLPTLADGNIRWVKIKSINPLGTYETYDLSVPDTHNFVANDIYVHNTEIMCVDGLHKVYTHKNYRALYVTPYTYQVDLIFRRLKELISDSPLVEDEVEGMKQSPYYQISFKNGSSLLGFSTGASTGKEAASVRGQRADSYVYYIES